VRRTTGQPIFSAFIDQLTLCLTLAKQPLVMQPKKEIQVMKFGGTSVGSVGKIQRVAEIIKRKFESGVSVIVVVSAMGKRTDELVDLAYSLTELPSEREMDALLSTGEQVTIALLSMALHNIGLKAKSITGWQIPIITNNSFSNARIEQIDTQLLEESLLEDCICVIAGFQGVTTGNEISTFGRGGSDTSAVAIAAAISAKQCEIYTDVPGVYSADPNKVGNARKLAKVSYDEMLEFASLGAGVLHGRAVEFAKKYGVPLHVRSTFLQEEGTLILSEDDFMEKLSVTGVSIKNDEARVSISEVPDRPGIAAELFLTLANAEVNVDMIVQSTGQNNKNTISFTVPKSLLFKAEDTVKDTLSSWGSGEFTSDQNISIVSAVGIGMKSHAGVAATMFKALANEGINIECISTSEIKISCIVSKEKGSEAMNLIHSAFDLDKEN
jgi:aspartate kinase